MTKTTKIKIRKPRKGDKLTWHDFCSVWSGPEKPEWSETAGGYRTKVAHLRGACEANHDLVARRATLKKIGK